jgi:ATP-dependent RNA helicase DHX37/DHR1
VLAKRYHIAVQMAQFKRRERKHKRLAKVPALPRQDAVPDELIPESASERALRRSKIAAQLREQQPESKITSKKRKRLEKYIDTKLKKEENAELLRKLAEHKVDTSLLRSSKKLGRVNETKRERFSRVLQEKAAGINNKEHDEVLFEQRPDVQDADGEEEEEQDPPSPANEVAKISPVAPSSDQSGVGLKRPLEIDESGQPVIKKRKRRKKAGLEALRSGEVEDDGPGVSEASEEEWNGFEDDDQDPHGDELEKSNGATSGTSESEDGDGIDGPEDLDASESSGSESDSEALESEVGSDSESVASSGGKKERVSAFKQWAMMQRNATLDFTPSTAPVDDAAIRANFKPRAPSPDPLLEALVSTKTKGERTTRPAAAITIPRSEEIQAARLELPVVQEEQRIMEAIHSNPIVIICGATGSGKTTQVPQMMFESGYGSCIGTSSSQPAKDVDPQSKGMIGVTQPRRVAAVSVADRVAAELGPAYKNRVAHQVRYDSNVSRDTAIKFMTDGILLREINQDFILSRYSAIVVDEAHERSVNTDILIGMLSRIVNLRAELAKEEPKKHYPLKLVIMSATLRVSDFAENKRLFKKGAPPIVQAEGRQYPVTVHFARRTQRDFVTETVNKVSRGHRKLPPGGMLVFLTSQNEIQSVAKQLREKLGTNTAGHIPMTKGTGYDDYEDDASFSRSNDYLEGEEDLESVSEADFVGLDPDKEDPEFDVPDDQPSFGESRGALKLHILPLYAALPSAQQLKVFQPPPAGSRLIVLATNVAETSLTIPGIRYVFDCGRAKEKRYDMSTGVQTFEVDWISKASASQRSGRAGRTGPGHCYRLYSSAVYEQYFEEHSVPEILRTPLESVVLQLKSMDIDKVVNFPFPTKPDLVQLQQAERLLINLGAIDEKNGGKITAVGQEIIAFPVSPRFGKMLLLARKNNLLQYTIAVVAALAVGDLFIPEVQAAAESAVEEEEDLDSEDEGSTRKHRKAHTASVNVAQEHHKAFNRAQATLARWDDQNDVVKLLTAVAVHTDMSSKNKPMSAATKFCQDYFLREKGMSEVQQLRHQLHNIVHAQSATVNDGIKPFTRELPLPNEKNRKLLTQLVAAGFIDQVAIRADLLKEDLPTCGRKPRRAVEVPYRTLIPSSGGEIDRHLPPQDQELQRSVFVHSSSVLAHRSVQEMPEYIVYSHLSRSAPKAISDGGGEGQQKVQRTRLHPLAIVGAKALATLAEDTPLLDVGKPVGKIEDVEGSAGKKRVCWVNVGLKAPSGKEGSCKVNVSWPLTVWKVQQKRSPKGIWEVEKVIAK